MHKFIMIYRRILSLLRVLMATHHYYRNETNCNHTTRSTEIQIDGIW